MPGHLGNGRFVRSDSLAARNFIEQSLAGTRVDLNDFAIGSPIYVSNVARASLANSDSLLLLNRVNIDKIFMAANSDKSAERNASLLNFGPRSLEPQGRKERARMTWT